MRIRLYSPGSGSAFLNCQTSSPCSNASTIRESTSDDREDEVLSWKKESSSSGIRMSAPIFLAMSRQRRRWPVPLPLATAGTQRTGWATLGLEKAEIISCAS